MKIKDIILPLGFAIITTLLIQNYFFPRRPSTSTAVLSGQQFVAPTQAQNVSPLQYEIDFKDDTLQQQIVKTVVDTPFATYTFSTAGAALEQLSFKRNVNGDSFEMQTITPCLETQREQKCFLIALPEKTPYSYTLEKVDESEQAVEVWYRAHTEFGILQKQFIISKHNYTIDLIVQITYPDSAKASIPTQLRLFYSSPYMESMHDRDLISGIYSNEHGAVKKIELSAIHDQTGWYQPTLFGADSRYFIHALIADAQQFVQRAYYAVRSNMNRMTSIIEGPTVQDSTTWRLSFYFGPKEQEVLTTVDTRLLDTLDYSGILAPVARFLLYLIKYFYAFLGNYGWAIVLLTVLIRLVLMPFLFRMQKGMKKQKEMQKKLAYIKKKFKDDRQALAQAQAELIREHGLPGLGGCLPLLLQIPIMFALNRILSSAIELYRAPFLLWSDLSMPDPYYIFPVLVAIGMMGQALTTEEQNQKIMLIIGGMVFGVFAAKFPVGLTMYFCIGTLLHLLQTVLQQRFLRQS